LAALGELAQKRPRLVMADQRLSKLPAGAIGAALGAVLVTRLAEFDARSVSALAGCSGTVLGRIAPAVLVRGNGARVAVRGGWAVGFAATLALAIVPVASFGATVARVLVFA
jgi:hypothetical protein